MLRTASIWPWPNSTISLAFLQRRGGGGERGVIIVDCGDIVDVTVAAVEEGGADEGEELVVAVALLRDRARARKHAVASWPSWVNNATEGSCLQQYTST